jgi:iron complex outermembrane recepter protein
LSSTNVAEAHEPETRSIDITATRLPEALAELSREAGASIGAEGSLPPLRTPPVRGRMSVDQALARLLTGSGYAARQVGPTAWRIERAPVQQPHPSAVPAAPADPLPIPEVVATEPIVVTAAKRRAALDALPMAVTVVRLDPTSSASPGSDTALVAAQSEGLAMTGLGPGRNRLFLRGVADSPFNGESQSTVAVVLDETRLTYAAPDPDIRLVDVERVEVLKGPQGSLYGSGTLGGIYHIVTRRADTNETSLAAFAGAEAVAHGSQGWSGSAVANLPIVRGTAALRLVGYGANEAGWVNTGGRKDSNRTSLLGARANLGVEAGGGWHLDLSGVVQLLESRDSRYVYAPGARSRPAQLSEPHDNDMRHLSARLTRQGHGLDVTLSTGFSWHEVGDTLDATVGAGSFGLASPSLLEDKRLYRVWDSELRFSGRAGGLRWLAGLSRVEARQTALTTLNSFSGGSIVIDDDRRNTFDTALFGDISLPIADRLSFDAGARLFRTTVVESRSIPAGKITHHRDRSGMTPSLALSWRPRPGRLLYLRYASAYRPGGSDIGPAGRFETLKSDELQTVEAGWRQEIGRGGRVDLGIFASRWENLQSDVIQPNGLIESANAGDARIVGAEAMFELPLSRSLRLEAGANITHAALTRNMLGIRLDDRRLPVVPRFALRGAVTYQFVLGPADASIKASLRYIGPQRLSFDLAIDRPMGSYLDSRIEAQARLGRTWISLAAENLFGGTDDSFAFGNPLRFTTTRQYTPQRPANVSIGMTVEF